MAPADLINLAPLLQYGFAGAWLIQFGVGTWLFLRAITVLDRLGDVVSEHSSAVRELRTHCEGQPRLSVADLRRVLQLASDQRGV